MMSIHEINRVAREAGDRAAKQNREPRVYSSPVEIEASIKQIPNLGNYRPKGWKLDDFVQSNKDGKGDGFSLGFDEVKLWVAETIGREKTYGYAIIEEGEFQVVLGRFVREGGAE